MATLSEEKVPELLMAGGTGKDRKAQKSGHDKMDILHKSKNSY